MYASATNLGRSVDNAIRRLVSATVEWASVLCCATDAGPDSGAFHSSHAATRVVSVSLFFGTFFLSYGGSPYVEGGGQFLSQGITNNVLVPINK